MKTKTKMIVAAAIAGVTAISAAVALAGKGHGHHHGLWDGGHGAHRVEKVAGWLQREVGLSDEQHGRVLQLGESLHTRMETKRKDMGTQLASAIRAPSMTREDAAALIDARRTRREEMRDVMADGLVELHAILTPVQRAKLAVELEKHGFFGKGRRGRNHRWGSHGWHDDGHDRYDD